MFDYTPTFAFGYIIQGLIPFEGKWTEKYTKIFVLAKKTLKILNSLFAWAAQIGTKNLRQAHKVLV